jgi:allantoinase
MADLVLRGRRVVTAGGVRPAAVHVSGGVIDRVAGYDDTSGDRLVEAGDAVVLPGLVDTHVHADDPGRADWEGFAHATRAAAAGGITTMVDMPLNSLPPTTTVAGLEAKLAAAAGRCHVDTGFWGGIVPGNLGELPGLVAAGALGCKAFLVDSGVEEFPPVDLAQLAAAMAALREVGAVTLVHAEAPEAVVAAGAVVERSGADRRSYRTWLESRPDRAETEAVTAVAELAAETGARAHVVHLSSAEALAPLRAARRAGARLSAETCPHYLTLAAEEVPDGATQHKCAPPVRGAANRERLWAALADGTIATVASDHSPCPAALKHLDDGDFLAAWGGIASLQLALPLVWTAARARGHTLADLARWMCAAPARLAGLDGRKGEIAAGRDADLVLFEPDAAFRVDPANLQHRHPVTPYAGRMLHGVVVETWLRGRRVHDRGRFAAPSGAPLLRGGSAA